jgi:hypothetical protein
MGLSVIGAGFGRTGTLSMKLALEALGFGRCHHMADVLSNPDQLAQWRNVAQGNLPNWDNILAGYNSAADRLLVYKLGDGWEPLCKFLNKPVPANPFPKNNSSDEFRAHVMKK